MTDPITRLNAALEGRYRIERELGEGGMSVVYLARDLRHQRHVALKVLKPELAAVVGAERFLAEIKTTANLQHPHILPLHDSGEADGFLYFVMPYIEGDTLRDKIDREKQLSVDEAIKITEKVASALDYAHQQGVVHRDIKPANILLTDGRPVIADFGIALAVAHAGGGRVTETGLSVGTPHYMSPEQATGDRDVDPRTDVYALGCVLYEMLTGDPPYGGSTAQAVLAKILTDPAPVPTRVRVSIPPNVDAAIRKALEKLPADRFTNAEEFSKALSDSGFRHGEEVVGAGPATWSPLQRVVAAVALISTVGVGWSLLRLSDSNPPEPVSRFSLAFEVGQSPTGAMRFTGDGSALIYNGPGQQLWIRRWSDLEAAPIRGTEGTVTFALSPDDREVAIVDGFPGSLRVVPLDGGPARTLLETAYTVSDWSDDGQVYINTVSATSEEVIARTSATGGGGVETLTEFRENERIHGGFDVLPGGRMGLFQVYYFPFDEGIETWAVDLDTRERRLLTVGRNARYSPTGHLLFSTGDGVLMAAPFDPQTAEFTGSAAPVAEGLTVTGNFGNTRFALSQRGTLIYEAGDDVSNETLELVWVTRAGEAAAIDPGWRFAPPTGGGASYGWRLSPGGDRVVLSSLVDGNIDIWMKQLPDGPLERVTFDDEVEHFPAWGPTDEVVTFARRAGGDGNAWMSRVDGIGGPELILDHEQGLRQFRWSPDGATMVFQASAPLTQIGLRDIMAFRPGVDTEATPLVATEFAEQDPALSPDGRWLAYSSNETGQFEVYVRPFPNVDSARVRVSTDGGVGPIWAKVGSELFFVNGDGDLIAALVETEPEFSVVQRETLFSVVGYEFEGNRDFYDIAPDDQMFLMGRSASQEEGSTRLIMVNNFFEELRQVVPD